jgi:hypothetical protein
MKHIDTTVLDARQSDDEEMPEYIYDPDSGEEVARVVYRSTDAWRGYYDTEPTDGWVKVGDGTNCGSWGDTPPGTSNEECEAHVDALEAEHGEILLVIMPTSNVFAMGYDVYARKACICGDGYTHENCPEHGEEARGAGLSQKQVDEANDALRGAGRLDVEL